MTIEREIIQAFITTQIAEIITVLAIRKLVDWRRWLLAVIIFNCFTHPLVIFSLRFLNWPYLPVEISVISIETALYQAFFKLGWKKSLFISIVTNLASISAGLIFRNYFP